MCFLWARSRSEHTPTTSRMPGASRALLTLAILTKVRHVPPYDTDGARQFSAEHVPFARLAEWAILLDVPGGGWSVHSHTQIHTHTDTHTHTYTHTHTHTQGVATIK